MGVGAFDEQPGAVEIGGGIGLNLSIDDEGKIAMLIQQSEIRAEVRGAQRGVEEVKRGLSGWQQEIALYGDPS